VTRAGSVDLVLVPGPLSRRRGRVPDRPLELADECSRGEDAQHVGDLGLGVLAVQRRGIVEDLDDDERVRVGEAAGVIEVDDAGEGAARCFDHRDRRRHLVGLLWSASDLESGDDHDRSSSLGDAAVGTYSRIRPRSRNPSVA
jgi:hypothetical protein